jgi:cyclophilin family peptidyl-prolyl cis-trans isomerase/HEAT repeat protein
LFSARNANVRSRAALAAGRIGDPAAVADLVTLLRDDEPFVRAMAAFALGEVEDQSGANALLGTLKDTKDPVLRARAIEALGKLAAALPKEQESRSRELGSAILDTLKFEAHRPDPDRLTVLLGLTATLRAKPANAGPIVADFLRQSDPRVRADAANTLARLKLNDGNDQLRKLLTTDPDPVVRANAARVLGATTDKEAFPALVERATKDQDSRVRVSAVRALAALNDHEPRVADALASLWCERRLLERKSVTYHQRDQGCLDLITALGRAFQGTGDKDILMRVRQWGFDFSSIPPEVEIAMMRISPQTYLSGLGGEDSAKRKVQTAMLTDWHEASSLAQALGEVATLPDSTNNKKQLVAKAESLLGAMLDYKNSGLTINTLVAVHSEIAVPDALRAYAAFKPKDLGEVLRKHLKESDVIIRSTAADLIGELPPDDANTRALVAALPVALADKELDDAALSILDSLGKQKNATANDAIKTALDSQDHLVRRRAVALLKANGAGDFSSRIGVVKTQNTPADYERAIARIGKQITARVTTDKGSFTINLLPEDAPLNVDNFIQLANRKYFNGIRVHRVVPNFVIQDGDPRGDGNGGPGYQIRCEINEVPYERGAVGMALSGKDTGGSQWFVTHSPQPHLDGGYTVFGNVIAGMETVDAIVRGDVIRSIVITESAPPTAKRRAR